MLPGTRSLPEPVWTYHTGLFCHMASLGHELTHQGVNKNLAIFKTKLWILFYDINLSCIHSYFMSLCLNTDLSKFTYFDYEQIHSVMAIHEFENILTDQNTSFNMPDDISTNILTCWVFIKTLLWCYYPSGAVILDISVETNVGAVTVSYKSAAFAE